MQKLISFALVFIGMFSFSYSLRAEIITAKEEKTALQNSGVVQSIHQQLVNQGAAVEQADEMVGQMSMEELAYFQSDCNRIQSAGSTAGIAVLILVLGVLILAFMYLSKQGKI